MDRFALKTAFLSAFAYIVPVITATFVDSHINHITYGTRYYWMGYWVALGFIFPFLLAYLSNMSEINIVFSKFSFTAKLRSLFTFLSLFAPILFVLWLNFGPELPHLAVLSTSFGYSLVIASMVYIHYYKLNLWYLNEHTMSQYEKLERVNFEYTNWSILSGFLIMAFVLFCLILYHAFLTLPKLISLDSNEQLLLFRSFVIELFIGVIFAVFALIEFLEKIQQIKNLTISHGRYAIRPKEIKGVVPEILKIKINPETLHSLLNVVGIAAIIISITYFIFYPGFPPVVAFIASLFGLANYWRARSPDRHKAGMEKKIHNVPYEQNLSFTGRYELLNDLRHFLTSETDSILKVAIFGKPGVGKTQLIIQYYYIYMYEYSAVLWVKSEKPDDLAADYANLATYLQLQEMDSKKLDQKIDAVKSWFEENQGWLLIFDNAQNPAEIEMFLPKIGSGNIIITSRNPNWETLANCLIEVPEFKREESIDFLIHRTGDDNKEAANNLAETMGDLPLGLEQAAAFMITAGVSIKYYQDLFQTKSDILNLGKPTAYEETIATTYSISIEKAKRDVPVSSDLLNLCSFLSPDGIPLSLLIEGAKNLPEPLASAIRDELELRKAIASLTSYSLININRDVISMHRLEQIAIKRNLSDEDRDKWNNAAHRLVSPDPISPPDD